MSTVMHCFRIPKKQADNFINVTREFFLSQDLLNMIVCNVAHEWHTEEKNYLEAIKMLTEGDMDETVDAQFFDRGSYWIVRVLSNGYLFLNNWTKVAEQVEGMTPVFYDNRSEVPKAQRKNKKIARWIDEQITAERFYMRSIISRNNIDELLMNARKDYIAADEHNQTE